MEAHSSIDGVIQSTLDNRRWDVGILVPGIRYATGTDVVVPPPNTIIYRLTTPMMRGEKVFSIQQGLKMVGFDPGTIDGEFGPHTLSAVVAFQISRQLSPDGEVGPQTATALGVTL